MSLTQLPASTETIPTNVTREQQLAQKHNTAAPYLRLQDELCRAFLQSGACPSEFEGVKLLFSPGSHVKVTCVAPGVIELRCTDAVTEQPSKTNAITTDFAK